MSSKLDLENGEDSSINTPLLSKKRNSEEDIKELIKRKGKSRVKWTIFFLLFFNSIAIYQCVLSVAAVENSLIKLYNWNATQYSIIVLMVPATALLATIIAPWLINIYSVNYVQLLSFIMLTIGQLLTYAGVKYYDQRQTSYGMLYTGRVLVGMCLGLNEVGLLTTLFLWFNETQWMGALSSLLFSTVEIGSLLARYAETPIVEAYDDVSLAFTFGIALGVISVVGQLILIYYDNQFRAKIIKEKRIDKHSLHYKIERDFSLIFKKFGWKQWILCLAFMVNAGMCIVYYLQMTVPVMRKYNVSQGYANIMLSTTSILVFLSTPFIGALMMLRKDLLVAIGGIIVVCVGLAFFYIPDPKSNITLGWFSIAFFGLGAPVAVASGMNALFATLSPELISVTNAMNSFGYFAVTAILTASFGVLEDKYDIEGAIALLIGGFIFVVIIIIPLICFKSEEDLDEDVEAV